MKHSTRYLMMCMLTAACSIPLESRIVTYYSNRSQGEHSPRRLIGYNPLKEDVDDNNNCWYGFLNGVAEYTQSCDSKTFKRVLFDHFGCDKESITISGSCTPPGSLTPVQNSAPTGTEPAVSRGANDWLAEYFYLPTDFKSTISFKPKITNFIVDLQSFMSLDAWYPGLYCALYAPLTHTRWDLNMCEDVIYQGSNVFSAGYFSAQDIQRSELMRDFTSYVNGEALDPFQQSVNPAAAPDDNVNFTIFMQPLTKARMSSKKLVRTRFADLRGVIGYRWSQCGTNSIGAALQLVAPTGNRPTADYLFEPIAGNGHHFGFGGNVYVNWELWRTTNEQSRLGIFVDATVTHLFGTRQKRTFDLINRPFSRYMLAEKLGTPVDNGLRGASDIDRGTVLPIGTTTPATSQFKNVFMPLANLSTLCVNVSVGVQADITAMFHGQWCDTYYDIGYNVWTRSGEKLSIRENPLANNKEWALKGNARVFGFAAFDDTGVPSLVATNDAVALSATQSSATIHDGTNVNDDYTPTTGTTNTGVDNAQFAFAGTTDVFLNTPPTIVGPPIILPIETSIQPVFLSTSALNVEKCGSRGLSSTIFAHVEHRYADKCGWAPRVGVGGSIELDHCNTACGNKKAPRYATSQWSIWLKLGASFG